MLYISVNFDFFIMLGSIFMGIPCRGVDSCFFNPGGGLAVV